MLDIKISTKCLFCRQTDQTGKLYAILAAIAVGSFGAGVLAGYQLFKYWADVEDRKSVKFSTEQNVIHEKKTSISGVKTTPYKPYKPAKAQNNPENSKSRKPIIKTSKPNKKHWIF